MTYNRILVYPTLMRGRHKIQDRLKLQINFALNMSKANLLNLYLRAL